MIFGDENKALLTTGGTYRRQTSAESLPLYETDPIYGNTTSVSENSAHHPAGL